MYDNSSHHTRFTPAEIAYLKGLATPPTRLARLAISGTVLAILFTVYPALFAILFFR